MQHRWMLILVAVGLVSGPASALVAGKGVDDRSREALVRTQLATPLIASSPAPRPAYSAPSLSDPFKSAFIVSSPDTFRLAVQRVAQNASTQHDRAGRALVVSEVREHRISDITQAVHDNENRCGGFFAFATRAEAIAFVRNDQSRLAEKRLPLAPYGIENASTVREWLPQVQETNILGTISQLSTSFQNRYFTTAQGRNAAIWIRDTWLALANGRSDVSAELFTGCTNCSSQPSVILTVQGVELPDEIVVLGAHLDSISSTYNGVGMVAPGADDDASGIATLTEVIRIALANGWRPRRTVKFMGYAAEEVGLRGSNAIAQSFRAQNRNVVGVLQLDMTNYRASSQVVNMRVVTDFSNAALSKHMTDVFDAYLAPMGLRRGAYTCGYGCSDHASWTGAGYPSAMMFEAGSGDGLGVYPQGAAKSQLQSEGYFPYIHTPNDILLNMADSAGPSVAFGQLGLAFLGEMAKTAGTPVNILPVASFKASAKGYDVQFTDLSTDPFGPIVSRQWTFNDGTFSTEANPRKRFNPTAAGEKVRVIATLTVTGAKGLPVSRTMNLSLPSGLNEAPSDKRQGRFQR